MNFKEWFKSLTAAEKILSFTILVLFSYILFTSRAVFNYYKFHNNYVSINGKTFTEDDIMASSPELMSGLKKDYFRNLSSVFNRFAQDKVLEMEAKSRGKNVDDMMKSIGGNPSEEEMKAVFDQYKNQLGGKQFADVKEEISDFLKSQKGNQEMTAIMEKYKVDIEMIKLPSVKKNVVVGNNPSVGSANAKVTLIEFSDFECPFCKRSQEVNRALREKYKDKIRWVFRDFPLPFHKDAMFAHIAVNCSIPQNKYWEFFNLLFDNSGKLGHDRVIELSKTIGLDQNKFNACIKDENIKKEIETDMAYAKSIGVNSTPTFFINGRLIEGAMPKESFEEIIEEELKK